MKSRKRQRENRRAKQREERIDKRNCCGVKDLTVYNAVRKIMTNLESDCVCQSQRSNNPGQSE